MVYVRGHALDFDRWHELGALGWDYQHVLPYFKKAENWAHGQGAADFTYRGQSGPLHVKNGDNPFGTPLFDAFIRAGEEAGYGVTKDYNAKRQEGFGPMAMTVHHSGPLRGTRCSASSAYLRPAKDRKNLTVKTKAHVRKILFETGKEVPRATGVEISQNGSGKVQRITARKEVILCAGAIHSPQLLQVSGVGDFNMLPMGAPRVLHAPGVGTNLQDHLELYFQQECLTQDSIAPSAGSALKKFLIGLEWMLTRSGPGSSNHFEAAAFVRSAAGIQEPNVQFHFLPMAVAYGSLEPTSETSTGHSFQIHVGTSLSKSRGYIRARTNDMQDAPMIKFNYMSHPSDWADMRAAIRIAREVISMPSMKPFAGREIMPGPECVSDESLDEYIRDNVESAYHPCGTCAMGTVLDAEGRVTGAEGLRVADASAFPHITNGNLNAPVIMLAERIADMIKGNVLPPHELAPEDAPWVAADWKLQDREKKANLAR
jgi:choline dehydrogenase